MDNTENSPIPPEWYDNNYYEKFNRGYAPVIDINSCHSVFNEAIKFLPVSSSSTILDIGCGRGELLIKYAMLGCRVYGIDYSSHAIQLASEALSIIGNQVDMNQVSISVMNAKELDFPCDMFDLVVMLDIVEHLYSDELDLVYKEIQRVLKPGGMLLIHTNPNRWSILPIKKIAKIFRIQIKSAPFHINEQTVSSLKKQLQDNFTIESIKLMHDDEFWYNATIGRGAIIRTLAKLYDIILSNPISKFIIVNTPLHKYIYSDIWVIAKKLSSK